MPLVPRYNHIGSTVKNIYFLQLVLKTEYYGVLRLYPKYCCETLDFSFFPQKFLIAAREDM